MARPSSPDATVLYDGECVLCRTAVRALVHDGGASRVETRSFHDPGVLEAFPTVDRARCEQALHVVRADGTVLTGVAAILDVTRDRWWSRPLRAAYARRLPRHAMDAAYAWVARHRSVERRRRTP